MDKKQMLQNGYQKKQLYLIISKDINGKEHFIVMEDLNEVKKYKSSSDQVQHVSMFIKGDI